MTDITENGFGEDYIPPEILDAAQEVLRDTIPEKSRNIYKKCYIELVEWQKGKKTQSFDEQVLLVYFSELSKKMVPASLWSHYSMLRTMINVEKNIDISSYLKLRNYIKKVNVGFKCKKSKVFTSEELDKFLNEAENNIHLFTKVVASIGITGACRRDEIHKLTINNIKNESSHMTINIAQTKTYVSRTFTVENKYRDIILEYLKLRPANLQTTKLFINFQKGKCTTQAVGINKIGSVPKTIARWLNLPDPQLYTGHSFRRTSATLLANAGASLTTLKRHGGWKSSSVAEGYIEDSISNKRKISKQITDSIDKASSSKNNDETESLPQKRLKVSSNSNKNGTDENDSLCTIQ